MAIDDGTVDGPTLLTLAAKPAKLTLVNMATGRGLEVMFNPTEFEEGFDVVYAALSVPGNSHQAQHYSYTGNYGFDFELFYDAIGRDQVQQIDEARRFLMSLGYPLRDGSGPPRVLVVWPSVVSMACLIKSCRFTNRLFNPDLAITQMVARVRFDEIRDVKIYSDEVFKRGTRRAAADEGIVED